jgi:hypothetical protein
VKQSAKDILQVKEAVRERDGDRCVRCGMTNAEHRKLFTVVRKGKGGQGVSLHVHRLVPGSIYTAQGCISLCQDCHGKAPEHGPKVEPRLHTVNGSTHTAAQWATISGTTAHFLQNRMSRGWSIEEAMLIPFWGKKGPKHERGCHCAPCHSKWEGKRLLAKALGIDIDVLRAKWIDELAGRHEPAPKKRKGE